MRSAAVLFFVALTGCTFGAPVASTPAPGGSTAATVVDVDLTLDPRGPLGAGLGGGYAPLQLTVATGSFVRFVNSDGFAHTVTSITGNTFPSAEPFDASALTPRGDRLSGGFSSGTLSAGASSAPILADAPGTYLYGCFFHYGAPMRAAIVVR